MSSENMSPEAAEMAAEYEADRQANVGLRAAAVDKAKAEARAMSHAADVEAAKAAFINALAFLVGTATFLGTVLAVTLYVRWVF